MYNQKLIKCLVLVRCKELIRNIDCTDDQLANKPACELGNFLWHSGELPQSDFAHLYASYLKACGNKSADFEEAKADSVFQLYWILLEGMIARVDWAAGRTRRSSEGQAPDLINDDFVRVNLFNAHQTVDNSAKSSTEPG